MIQKLRFLLVPAIAATAGFAILALAPPGGQSASTSSDSCAGFTFASFYTEADEFCGTVTEIRRMATIPGSEFYDPVTAPPGSDFAVVFMTVNNFSSAPDDVGIFSFRLRDSLSRIFTMDFPDQFSDQLTAEAHFDRMGTYETLQPGITYDMVFVFLTPTDATGLVAERCPTDGCNEGATPPGSPPSGCVLVFASFYSESDEFCGTQINISRMTTIPGSDFYDPVTAPPGGDFALLFLTVKNFGFAPDYVGSFSLRLRDSLSRIFTMDFPDQLTAQFTAEAHFGLNGPYETIQPGITYDMVLVFLTPTDATGLVAEHCPTDGCEAVSPPTPTPTPTATPGLQTPTPTPTATAKPSPTPTPTPASSPGDVNGDGRETITDALLVAQVVAALINESDLAYPQYADVNSDGRISITDALLIAQQVAGLV